MRNQFPPEPLPVPMSNFRSMPKGDELNVILRRLQPLMGGATPRPGRKWLPDDLRVPVDAMSRDALDRSTIWLMPYHFTAYTSDLAAFKRYLDSEFGVSSTLTVALLLRDMYPICKAIVNERKAVRLRAMKKAA